MRQRAIRDDGKPRKGSVIVYCLYCGASVLAWSSRRFCDDRCRKAYHRRRAKRAD